MTNHARALPPLDGKAPTGLNHHIGYGAAATDNRPDSAIRECQSDYSPAARNATDGRPSLGSPRGHCPDGPSATRRGQRPVARLPLSSRRHRDQHPPQVRDHLDADDLRAADFPDARPTGSTVAAVAVAGHSGRAAGARRRRASRAATSAIHQDTYAARRHSFRRPSHVRRDGPASDRCIRLDVLPGPTDRPSACTAAAEPIRTAWASWTLQARQTSVASWIAPSASWSTANAARAHASSTTLRAAGAGRVTRAAARGCARLDQR